MNGMDVGMKPAGAATVADAVISVSDPAKMRQKLGGMRIIERQLFTLARAGVRRVWVPRSMPVDGFRLPPGLEILRDDGEHRAPYVIISGDHLVKVDAMRDLLSRPYPRSMLYQDADGRGVVQVLVAGDQGRDNMPPGSTANIRDRALPWLLKTAIKGQDSFMARHFDRHVSLAVTRRLLDTPVKPNHMTIFSSLVGMAGAVLLARGDYAGMLAGTLIIWAHTLFDGCDGELARLRFQESRFGGVLDFWGDNLIHFTLFSCLGLGLYKSSGEPVYAALGFAAAASSLLSAQLVYRHSQRRAEGKDGSGPFFQGLKDIASEKASKGKRALAKLQHMLSQRDFIYLLVVLAAFGRLEAFLWAAGIGSPLFALALAYLSFQRGVRND